MSAPNCPAWVSRYGLRVAVHDWVFEVQVRFVLSVNVIVGQWYRRGDHADRAWLHGGTRR